MLTDAEVAGIAHQLLRDELSRISPQPGLLASVRARHRRAQATRRTTTAMLAAITTAGLATAVLAGTTAAGHTTGHRTAAAGDSARSKDVVTQTIVLDGFTVRVAPPLAFVRSRGGGLIATLDGKHLRLSMLLYGGRIPPAAVKIEGWPRLAYLLEGNGTLSLYLPIAAAGPHYHSLVIAGRGVSRSELLRLASAIVAIAGPHVG